jgi:hypothetical protein
MVTTTHVVFAAAGFLGLSRALAIHAQADYRSYRGDGSIADGWPAVSDWADFETM